MSNKRKNNVDDIFKQNIINLNANNNIMNFSEIKNLNMNYEDYFKSIY